MIFVTDISSRKIAPGQTISVFGGFFDPKVGISFGDKAADIVECEDDIVSAAAPNESGTYDVKVYYDGNLVKTFTGVSVAPLSDTPSRNLAKDYTSEDFDQYIRSLFPRGAAFAMDRESNLSKMIASFVFVFAYVWRVIHSMLDALDPTHTSNFDEWESELALPVVGIEGQTPAERRSEIYRSECLNGSPTNSYIKKMLSLMGKDADVYEYTKDTDKFSGIVLPEGEDPRFYLMIVFHLNEDDFTYFRAGSSSAGDYLMDFAQYREEAVFNEIKQAHTKIIFGYKEVLDILISDDGFEIVDDEENIIVVK